MKRLFDVQAIIRRVFLLYECAGLLYSLLN